MSYHHSIYNQRRGGRVISAPSAGGSNPSNNQDSGPWGSAQPGYKDHSTAARGGLTTGADGDGPDIKLFVMGTVLGVLFFWMAYKALLAPVDLVSVRPKEEPEEPPFTKSVGMKERERLQREQQQQQERERATQDDTGDGDRDEREKEKKGEESDGAESKDKDDQMAELRERRKRDAAAIREAEEEQLRADKQEREEKKQREKRENQEREKSKERGKDKAPPTEEAGTVKERREAASENTVWTPFFASDREQANNQRLTSLSNKIAAAHRAEGLESKQQLLEEISALLGLTDTDDNKGWYTHIFSRTPDSSPILFATSQPKGLTADPDVADEDDNHVAVLLVLHADTPRRNEDSSIKSSLYDSKGALAAIVQLFEYAAKLDGLSKYNVGILVATDRTEETDKIGGAERGSGGVYYAIADPNGPMISAEVAIVTDGGDNFKIVTQEKGRLLVRLTVEGTPGQAAQPWEGSNSLHLLLSDIQALRESSTKASDKGRVFDNQAGTWHTTLAVIDLKTSAGEGGGKSKNAKSNTNTISGQSASAVVSSWKGGEIPEKAQAIIDIRYTKEEWSDAKTLLKHIRSVLKEAEVEVLDNAPAFSVAPSDKIIREGATVISRYVELSEAFARQHSTSELRYFSEEEVASRGVVAFRPGAPRHPPDHKALVAYQHVIADLLDTWAL